MEDRNEIIIDLRRIPGKTEIIDEIYRKMNAPEYAAKNYDALHDIITEFGGNTTVILRYYDAFQRRMPKEAEIFRTLLEDCEEEKKGFKLELK